MSENNSFKHLTLEERRIIFRGIENGATKVSIANTLGKNKSTIGKEIKSHRELTYKCTMPLECKNYKKCKFNRLCNLDCPSYIKFTCKRRDTSPGACNGCLEFSKCRFDKFKYIPEKAQTSYLYTLSDSRTGVNLTASEAKEIADIIKPLLLKGQSPYQIVTNHPELGICEKTLYNYIENGVFHEMFGITVMDLRRQVNRKITKKISAKYKKRADKKYLQGRMYKDYSEYIKLNEDLFVVEMDTVYNDETNGPFIQTFKFLNCGFLFGLLHDEKTSKNMKYGVDKLEEILGSNTFKKYVSILLTDRGTEFVDASGMETSIDETRRTRVFYCDPMQSGQKGSLENNHTELRYILPKKMDLRNLGLKTQQDLNLVVSHVNSFPVERLGGKSPLDLMEFMYPELYEKFKSFGITKIEKDKVILKPYLLKK